MQIIIIGTGRYYRLYKPFFDKFDDLIIMDFDKKKEGELIDGRRIVSAYDILKYTYDYIFVLSVLYFGEIKKHLMEIGVTENSIRSYAEIYEVLGENNISSPVEIDNVIKDPSTKDRVMMVTPNLDINGGVEALFQMTKIIFNFGYEVCVISGDDGIEKARFMTIGASVVINKRILVYPIEKWGIDYDRFKAVIINTINFIGPILFGKYRYSHFVIWLHHLPLVYESIPNRYFEMLQKKSNTEKISIYAVGELARKPLIEKNKNFNIGLLPYCIEDFYVSHKSNVNPKTIIAVIGRVSELKGQDIVIESWYKMDEGIRNKSELWIIGDNNTELGRFLMSIAKEKNCGIVRFFGEVASVKMHELYNYIDIVIVPSRGDVLPVVVAEAMMNKKICVISEMVGTSKKVLNGTNCYRFDGSSDGLCDAIKKVFNNKNKWEEIGDMARKLYKEEYSIDSMKIRMSKIVDGIR